MLEESEKLPHILLVTGDFNVRSSRRWSDDTFIIEGCDLNQ